MKAELAFEVRPDYLYVAVRGPSDLETMREGLGIIKARADETGRTRILMDVRAADAPTEMDRFFAGQFIAELFGPRYRLAALYAQQAITKFGENAAVNRGANLLITHDEALALRWLLGEER